MPDREFNRHLDDLYAACDDDAAFHALPSVIARACDARSAIVLPAAGAGAAPAMASYFDPAAFQRYLDQFASIDPWRPAFAALHARGQGGAQALDALVPPEEFQRSTMYNELFRPIGDDTGRAMGILAPPPAHGSVIAAHRAARDKPFEPRDTQRLDAIAPHVARVLRLRGLLMAERAAGLHLKDLAEASGRAILALDTTLKVLALTDAARDLLEQRDGLALAGGHLVCDSPPLARSLKAGVHAVTSRQGEARTAFACPRPSGSGPLHLALHPAASGPARHALLLIDDPAVRRPEGRRVQDLRQIFRLSPGETDLALNLLCDQSLEQIAQARRVTKETVRSQLRALFHKTDTTRQSTLVRLLSRFA
ncbi:helix-turn-helix transcriptional regulator [Novosphingobium sp. 1949]|uniref:Helix-turn-helix transcriptional regulator n=1 Tax=Novosphingobium organovorum TaxID=2930092 RepID=A0ABT0BDI2_9SPHN|nr:helix-turn-helix transcriptional regulator [Novosphingobium organovorum]MCJ2182866.1 helix-turn-helix transcriptional regulator [Novosphingobium organovorum]